MLIAHAIAEEFIGIKEVFEELILKQIA